MPTSKSYSSFLRLLRFLSILNVVIWLPACIFCLREMVLPALTAAFNISTAMMFLAPDTYGSWRGSIIYAGVMVAVSISAVVCCLVWGRPDPAPLVCQTASIIVFALCLLLRIPSMMRDVTYLTMTITGWELFLHSLKLAYFSLYAAILTFSCASCSIPGLPGKWISLVASIASLAMYVAVLVRSYANGPVISYSDDGMPYGEKDVAACAFISERSHVNDLMYCKLCRYVEENKPFLNPDYTLESLSRALISNKSYISRVINDGSGLNFCQLMNRYRVNFARQLFQDNPDLKVKDLSEMSGFNSQVSFNMAFKLFYESTPGLWCKEYRDSVRVHKRPSSQKGQGQ